MSSRKPARVPRWNVVEGNCLEVLKRLPDNFFDANCTDPPYGLGFMCADWDYEVPGPEYWLEQLRVAKPGAHLAAFGGTRTYHRLTCAIEDAGWEIRDSLTWLYGSGFPHSHSVAMGIDKKLGLIGHRGQAFSVAGDHIQDMRGNKPGQLGQHVPISPEAQEWAGWQTTLKPCWEPIILARKPFKGSVASNVLKYGTGALNIDACRLEDTADGITINTWDDGAKPFGGGAGHNYTSRASTEDRWPPNVLLDEEAAQILDDEVGILTSGKMKPTRVENSRNVYGKDRAGGYISQETIGDSGGASRFFYTAKASKSEKEAGLDHLEAVTVSDGRKKAADNAYQRGKTKRKNPHPTVKPLSLMEWLCQLICPPKGLILDPFMGSGSTGCAAVKHGFRFYGIDLSARNVLVARGRIVEALERSGRATVEDLKKSGGRKHIQLGLLPNSR